MSSSQNKKEVLDKQTFPQISTTIVENSITGRKHKMKKQLSTISNYYINPQKRTSSHREFKNQTKILLDNNLPDIKSKNKMKRGSFLQMWLDQTLEAKYQKNKADFITTEAERTGALKNLQCYQIDKKYLKSQNISTQIIDKLYQTLYVYTHGINQTFEEVLGHSKNSQHGGANMINNFWKAYIKLIQGCTSFQTTFQIIEQDYKRHILQLKQQSKKREIQFTEQKVQYEVQIDKLNKKITQQTYQYDKLANDYSISQMTLELTDMAFNGEVQTRLKFEQKVNAMFTGYEQIREKYDKLRERSNIKDEQFIERKTAENQIQKDLQQAIISNSQLTRQIALINQTIHQQQSQLELKRQEITQIQQRMTAYQFQKQYQVQKIRQKLSQSADYKQKYQNLQNQLKIKDYIISQNKQKYDQKQKMIIALRMSNQNIYQKYQKLTQLKSLLQSQKIKNLNTIQQNKKQILKLQKQLQKINKINKQIMEQCQMTKNKLKLAEDQIKMQKQCIIKNTALISSLQTVKNKYQKLYNITLRQKYDMQNKYNQNVCAKDNISEQLQGMKMLLQNRNKELQESYARLQNQKDLFKKKMQGLKQQIEHKQTQILAAYQKNVQDKQITASKLKQYQKLKQQNISFKQDKLKSQSQNFYLRQKQAQMLKQRQANRKVVQDLNVKIEDLSKTKQIIILNLNQKQYILNISKNQNNFQNQQLRILIKQYRQQRLKKSCYIHPMLFQDQRQQINRLIININQLKIEKLMFDQKINQVKYNFMESKVKCQELQGFLLREKDKVMSYQQKIQQLQKQKVQTFNKSQEIKRNLKAKIKSIEKQLSQIKNSQKISKQQQQLLKSQIKDQQLTINKQQADIIKYKRGLNEMIQQNQNKRVQINQLRDQLAHKKPDSRSSHQQHRNNPVIKKISSRQSQRNHQAYHQMQKFSLQQIKEVNQVKMKKGQEVGINTQIIKYGDRAIQTQQIFSHKNKFLPRSSNEVNQYPTGSNEVNQYGCQMDVENEQKDDIDRQKFQPLRPIRQQHKQFKKVQGNQFKRALKITYMRR